MMALDQYYKDLNAQLKSGDISNADYTEKYMAYSYGQRVARLESSGIGKESTLYIPTYLDSKQYNAIVNPIDEVSANKNYLTSAGNTILSGQADTIKSNPLPLLIIAFLVMLFLAD